MIYVNKLFIALVLLEGLTGDWTFYPLNYYPQNTVFQNGQIKPLPTSDIVICGIGLGYAKVRTEDGLCLPTYRGDFEASSYSYQFKYQDSLYTLYQKGPLPNSTQFVFEPLTAAETDLLESLPFPADKKGLNQIKEQFTIPCPMRVSDSPPLSKIESPEITVGNLTDSEMENFLNQADFNCETNSTTNETTCGYTPVESKVVSNGTVSNSFKIVDEFKPGSSETVVICSDNLGYCQPYDYFPLGVSDCYRLPFGGKVKDVIFLGTPKIRNKQDLIEFLGMFPNRYRDNRPIGITWETLLLNTYGKIEYYADSPLRRKKRFFWLIIELIMEAIAFAISYIAYQTYNSVADATKASFLVMDKNFESVRGTMKEQRKLINDDTIATTKQLLDVKSRSITSQENNLNIQVLDYKIARLTERVNTLEMFFLFKINMEEYNKITNGENLNLTVLEEAKATTEKELGIKILEHSITPQGFIFYYTKCPLVEKIPLTLNGTWILHFGKQRKVYEYPIITWTTFGMFCDQLIPPVLDLWDDQIRYSEQNGIICYWISQENPIGTVIQNQTLINKDLFDNYNMTPTADTVDVTILPEDIVLQSVAAVYLANAPGQLAPWVGTIVRFGMSVIVETLKILAEVSYIIRKVVTSITGMAFSLMFAFMPFNWKNILILVVYIIQLIWWVILMKFIIMAQCKKGQFGK